MPAAARVAVVGIGNELNGDDAVGLAVVRRLRERLGARPDVLLIEGGVAPENFTGALRRFQPSLVVLVDAAHLGEEPGSLAWIDPAETDGLGASTHTLAPSVLASFLVQELGCRVALLGIQPAHLNFASPLSPAVAAAVDKAAETIIRRLKA